MTRKQAIAELKAMKTTHKSLDMQGINSDVPMDEDSIKALDMAISALSAESKVLEDITHEIRKYLEDVCINENEAEGIMFCLDVMDIHISRKGNNG